MSNYWIDLILHNSYPQILPNSQWEQFISCSLLAKFSVGIIHQSCTFKKILLNPNRMKITFVDLDSFISSKSFSFESCSQKGSIYTLTENHGRYKLLDKLRENNGVFGGTWIVVKKKIYLNTLRPFLLVVNCIVNWRPIIIAEIIYDRNIRFVSLLIKVYSVINLLSASFTKWSDIVKQFVGKLPLKFENILYDTCVILNYTTPW